MPSIFGAFCSNSSSFSGGYHIFTSKSVIRVVLHNWIYFFTYHHIHRRHSNMWFALIMALMKELQHYSGLSNFHNIKSFTSASSTKKSSRSRALTFCDCLFSKILTLVTLVTSINDPHVKRQKRIDQDNRWLCGDMHKLLTFFLLLNAIIHLRIGFIALPSTFFHPASQISQLYRAIRAAYGVWCWNVGNLFVGV